jgi:hypothetical protein
MAKPRRALRDLFWWASDRLCAHPHTLRFELGHWLGELGWKLRDG